MYDQNMENWEFLSSLVVLVLNDNARVKKKWRSNFSKNRNEKRSI